MSARFLLGLAATTLIVSLAALVAVLLEPRAGPLATGDEPAFERLREDPQAVARIAVETAAHETILERTGNDWVVASRHGYPAATQQIRDLVIELVDMRLIEAKTARSDRLARLELRDVEAEGSAARRIRLESAGGDVLAHVLLGKDRNRLTGTEPAGTYIRRPGEAQAWLASGRVELPDEPAGWLAPAIVDLPVEQVQSVEVTPPDGPTYLLTRNDPDQGFELAGPGDLAGNADPAELAGALAGLNLEDVRPAGGVAWPDEFWRFRFTTFEGLGMALRIARVDDVPWLQIEEVATPPNPAPALAGRTQALRERTAGWAYRVPGPVQERLMRGRASWVAAADPS